VSEVSSDGELDDAGRLKRRLKNAEATIAKLYAELTSYYEAGCPSLFPRVSSLLRLSHFGDLDDPSGGALGIIAFESPRVSFCVTDIALYMATKLPDAPGGWVLHQVVENASRQFARDVLRQSTAALIKYDRAHPVGVAEK
jgi:hypothetical protein